MNIKKFGLGIMILAFMAPISLTACVEKTETENVVAPGEKEVEVETKSQQGPNLVKENEKGVIKDEK